MTTEAHEVAVKLLSEHFGKPLPAAIWSAQRGRALTAITREGPTSSPASILSGCASSRMTFRPISSVVFHALYRNGSAA